ncbi:MAG TPA: hypothetical protein VEM96_21075 [Pyrinomonadaceae bacterium]|nr:hypothetical protein [Pyrinomonadaceae bacterium]
MKELEASDASMLARIAETIEIRQISTGELRVLTDRLQTPEAKTIARAIVNPEAPGIQSDIQATAEAFRHWAGTNTV